MNNHIVNPIEHILNMCESGVMPCRFDIFNAKDELKRLRGGLDYLRVENNNLKDQIKEQHD
jgi:hypothetical protein